jgi:class 3 adenylate cyclase
MHVFSFSPRVRSGNLGAELLNKFISMYFGKLITIIFDFGGDVVKFAGDAMLVVWRRGPDQPFREIVLKALACNLQLLDRLNNYSPTPGVKLQLHTGVGAGKLAGVFVGGVGDHWEFFVAGDPIQQMSGATDEAQSGEVVLSREAFKIVAEDVVRSATQSNQGNVIVTGIVSDTTFVQARAPIITGESMELAMTAFVPSVIKQRMDKGETDGNIAEFRNVYVMFIVLPDFDYTDPATLRRLQTCVCVVQAVVRKYNGYLARLLADDKGTRFKICFGMPHMVHEDDSVRCVKAGLEIQQTLRRRRMQTAIGVATGVAYCGQAGSGQRCEYTAVGGKVVVAARLMQAAAFGGFLCDEETYKAAQHDVRFERRPPIRLKGVVELVSVYRPHEYDTLRDAVNEQLAQANERERENTPVTVNTPVSTSRGYLTQLSSDINGASMGASYLACSKRSVSRSSLSASPLYEFDSLSPLLQVRGLDTTRGLLMHTTAPCESPPPLSRQSAPATAAFAATAAAASAAAAAPGVKLTRPFRSRSKSVDILAVWKKGDGRGRRNSAMRDELNGSDSINTADGVVSEDSGDFRTPSQSFVRGGDASPLEFLRTLDGVVAKPTAFCMLSFNSGSARPLHVRAHSTPIQLTETATTSPADAAEQSHRESVIVANDTKALFLLGLDDESAVNAGLATPKRSPGAKKQVDQIKLTAFVSQSPRKRRASISAKLAHLSGDGKGETKESVDSPHLHRSALTRSNSISHMMLTNKRRNSTMIRDIVDCDAAFDTDDDDDTDEDKDSGRGIGSIEVVVAAPDRLKIDAMIADKKATMEAKKGAGKTPPSPRKRLSVKARGSLDGDLFTGLPAAAHHKNVLPSVNESQTRENSLASVVSSKAPTALPVRPKLANASSNVSDAGDDIIIVGRDEERNLLLAQLVSVMNTGGSRAVVITGESGIGKTNLLIDFCAAMTLLHTNDANVTPAMTPMLRRRRQSVMLYPQLSTSKNRTWMAYGCGQPNEGATPFYVWKSVFDQLLGETPIGRNAQLHSLLEKIDDSMSFWPLLNDVLSTSFEETKELSEMGEAAREAKAFDMLVGAVVIIASRQRSSNNKMQQLPTKSAVDRVDLASGSKNESGTALVIVLEDTQWFDRSSLLLVKALLVRQVPHLLLLMSNSDSEFSLVEHSTKRSHPQGSFMGSYDQHAEFEQPFEKSGSFDLFEGEHLSHGVLQHRSRNALLRPSRRRISTTGSVTNYIVASAMRASGASTYAQLRASSRATESIRRLMRQIMSFSRTVCIDLQPLASSEALELAAATFGIEALPEKLHFDSLEPELSVDSLRRPSSPAPETSRTSIPSKVSESGEHGEHNANVDELTHAILRANGHPLFIEELCNTLLLKQVVMLVPEYVIDPDHSEPSAASRQTMLAAKAKKLLGFSTGPHSGSVDDCSKKAARLLGLQELHHAAWKVKYNLRFCSSKALKQFPASLEALFVAKIDALPSEMQTTLKVCAVIGNHITVDLLVSIHPAGFLDKKTLQKWLDLLVKESILIEISNAEDAISSFVDRMKTVKAKALGRSSANRGYRFRQAYAKDAAYAMLTMSSKQQIHNDIVTFYRQRIAVLENGKNGEHNDQSYRYDLLAHHAEAAENWPAAIFYLQRASMRAAKKNDHQKAISYLLRMETNLRHREGVDDSFASMVGKKSNAALGVRRMLLFLYSAIASSLFMLGSGSFQAARVYIAKYLALLDISLPASKHKLKLRLWRLNKKARGVVRRNFIREKTNSSRVSTNKGSFSERSSVSASMIESVNRAQSYVLPAPGVTVQSLSETTGVGSMQRRAIKQLTRINCEKSVSSATKMPPPPGERKDTFECTTVLMSGKHCDSNETAIEQLLILMEMSMLQMDLLVAGTAALDIIYLADAIDDVGMRALAYAQCAFTFLQLNFYWLAVTYRRKSDLLMESGEPIRHECLVRIYLHQALHELRYGHYRSVTRILEPLRLESFTMDMDIDYSPMKINFIGGLGHFFDCNFETAFAYFGQVVNDASQHSADSVLSKDFSSSALVWQARSLAEMYGNGSAEVRAFVYTSNAKEEATKRFSDEHLSTFWQTIVAWQIRTAMVDFYDTWTFANIDRLVEHLASHLSVISASKHLHIPTFRGLVRGRNGYKQGSVASSGEFTVCNRPMHAFLPVFELATLCLDVMAHLFNMPLIKLDNVYAAECETAVDSDEMHRGVGSTMRRSAAPQPALRRHASGLGGIDIRRKRDLGRDLLPTLHTLSSVLKDYGSCFPAAKPYAALVRGRLLLVENVARHLIDNTFASSYRQKYVADYIKTNASWRGAADKACLVWRGCARDASKQQLRHVALQAHLLIATTMHVQGKACARPMTESERAIALSMATTKMRTVTRAMARLSRCASTNCNADDERNKRYLAQVREKATAHAQICVRLGKQIGVDVALQWPQVHTVGKTNG